MDLIWLIPLLPGFGAALNGLLGIRYFSRRLAALIACTTMGLALAVSLYAFFQLLALPPAERLHDVMLAQWIPPIPLETVNGIGHFEVPWTLRLDPLSAMMILIVTGIGFLIHVYSTAYMQDEPRGAYARFFCYLNLFCFFMLTLVLGANFLVMFVGWEGVGLCSYLLIGYWYEKKSASDAGKKAFIVNRVGDWGFVLGVFLIFFTFGTLDFRAVNDAAGAMPIETSFGVLSVICLLLFVGATGKSAQIPLYVWLPDAMEGPTPVSALIHAATMVTAGVYMVCRNAVLFTHAPEVMAIIAVVGALTALVAASIGLVQTDIKRVLAYSTVSQLGYMFLATGVGAFAAGAFHLMTHAFFKALLFLGSGSVIHAMGGEQDMNRMGNLRKYMPVTFVTMMVGTLAIAGIPLFSGFFSKDEILLNTFLANKVLWVLAAATAFMTAFYMFRLMALTFFGAYRGPAWAHGGGAGEASHGPAHADDAHGHGGHGGGHGHGEWHGPHESPAAMTWPLAVLAVGACVAGFVGVPDAIWENKLARFLEPSLTARSVAVAHAGETAGEAPEAEPAAPAAEAGHAPAAAEGALEEAHGEAAGGGHHVSLAVELGLMAFSVLVAIIGIALARHIYLTKPEQSEQLAERFAGAHRTLLNKYYVDELYDATIISGTMAGARGLWTFDGRVVDGGVNGSGWLTVALAWVSHMIDKYIVDGAVNLVGRATEEWSFSFRRFQTGLVQNYALLMLFGVFGLVSLYLFRR